MFYSLRSRLILAFVLLLAVSFFSMFLISYDKSGAIIRSDNESAALEKMDAYTALITSTVNQIYDFSSIIYNSDLTKSWDDTQADPKVASGQKMLSNINFSKFLTKTVSNYSTIAACAVYRTNGLYVGTDNHIVVDPAFQNTAWYKAFYQSGRHWVLAQEDPYETSRLLHQTVISFLIPIGTFEPTQARSLMKVDVRTSYFMTPLNQIHLGKNGTIFLLDDNGRSVLTQHPSGAESEVYRQLGAIRNSPSPEGVIYDKHTRDPMIFVYKKLEANDWMLVGAVPESGLMANLLQLKSAILFITLLLLALSVIVAIWMSYGFTKPLSRLALAMRYVQRGEFDQAESRLPGQLSIRNEVGFVTSTFRNMIKHLREHIKSEFESKLSRQQAEYRSLLLQINPHFLFNTLELLSSLVMQRRSGDAVRVIEALGKMLRFSLNTSDDLVRLSDEIRHTRYYLDILKLRFADQLDLQVRNEVASERCVIVKFLLQPLVENAVKFGFQQRESVRVAIHVRTEGDKLILSVADNGMGMEPDFLEQLRKEYRTSKIHQVLGAGDRRIGLRNILARCSLYYGEQFAFDILSEPGEGTDIRLILPIQEGGTHV